MKLIGGIKTLKMDVKNRYKVTKQTNDDQKNIIEALKTIKRLEVRGSINSKFPGLVYPVESKGGFYVFYHDFERLMKITGE